MSSIGDFNVSSDGYDDDEHCEWLLECVSGGDVSVNVTALDLTEGFDYLTLADSEESTQFRLTGTDTIAVTTGGPLARLSFESGPPLTPRH